MSISTSQPSSPESSEALRSIVVADMSVSLDGFVADPDDGVDRVFAWYGKPQPAGATGSDRGASGLGVILYGRRTFEVANGWGGNHPVGVPVIVVTHSMPDGWPRPDSTVLFNTEGIESAVEQAKQIAGGKIVALGSPTIIQQCLDRGLVDRLQVSLVPLLLGRGIRLFENLDSTPIELENPTVSEGNGVTHLHYDVRGR
jgi:dihydrofolate reductase